eukprot:CAMPEP_0177681368 /NCGR_PEP_ID=MMETSP0447-20121125/30680_1 /TAXON_ID=0 /ORGANISM="Stygamoeba regulata, Strain BSH-02190019" /LENGTH=544 /DNA_ID=CAMNT_0019190783 /DNA_START=237 /DNA_END=1867 /DNA_ORIENTATION=-
MRGAPFSAENPLRAMYLFVGPVSDIAWSFSHNQARVAVERQFQGLVKTHILESIPENDSDGALTSLLISLADEGFDLIVGASFGYGFAMSRVAELYPTQYFLHISGNHVGPPNYSNAFGRIFEARFLAGIVAGAQTRSNKIGMLASLPIPEVYRGVNAFERGMQLSNPDATLYVHWTNTWFDPDLEAYASEQMLVDVEVDVLTHFMDSFAVQRVAHNMDDKWSVGYHSDMGIYVGNSVLTSALWNWTPLYVHYISAILNGSWVADNYWGSISDGIVDVGTFSPSVDEAVVASVMAQRAQLINGEVEVFCGATTLQWMYAESANPERCLTDAELLNMSNLSATIVDLGDISIPLEEILLPKGLTITAQVLASVVILLAVVCIVLLFVFRDNPVIRCASPIFCVAMCIGSIVMLISVYFLSHTPNSATCILFPWFVSIGFTLFYGNLLAKSARVYWLFRSMKHFRAIQVRARHFMPVVGVFLLIDIIMLVLFTSIDVPSAQTTLWTEDSDLSPYTYRWECTYRGASSVMVFIIIGYKAFLLLLGMV